MVKVTRGTIPAEDNRQVNVEMDADTARTLVVVLMNVGGTSGNTPRGRMSQLLNALLAAGVGNGYTTVKITGSLSLEPK
jgi:hypothetical protein